MGVNTREGSALHMGVNTREGSALQWQVVYAFKKSTIHKK